MLQEFKDRFRNLELRNETKKGSSVYNGIFNLFVIQGARDWVTGTVPQYGDLDDHHIVPASWGAKHLKHLKDVSIHTILNRTPLTADTNRHIISDRLPNAYLPELIAASGEGAVRAILESHFISPAAQEILLRAPFGPEDYEAFISERQRTILTAIENLLIKERLDLAPDIRKLDEDIETTELALRKLIATNLNNDPAQLPQNINVKLSEFIQRSAKKNAALDADNFKELDSRLEYADFRELQDIITSKATWAQFEPRFANKETVNAKFGQLAELRNAIRHSRTVDEITCKEGEAAILWFRQVLNT
jgi:hypothetical protein